MTTTQLWDPNFGLPQLAVERDGAGATLRTTTYGLGPLSLTEGGQTSYLHADRLGSILATSSTSGQATWSYRYDPFGTARIASPLDPAAPGSPYRFTGQVLDPSGLYHLRARQYDPTTGRFLSTDPVAAAIGDAYVASYVYARNNPVRWTDPSGWCPWCIVGAIVGGAFGAASYIESVPHGGDWDWGQLVVSTGAGAVAAPSVAPPSAP